YFAMQMFFGSVKKRSASSPPSRPTPLCFMPPNGTRRSRTSQQFIQTVPVMSRNEFICVQFLEKVLFCGGDDQDSNGIAGHTKQKMIRKMPQVRSANIAFA